MIEQRYNEAKEIYKKIGVDTDKAIEILKNIPISMHCWQGDDVGGFEGEVALTGGIQATGNYMGKATNFNELSSDIHKALSMIGGTHRLNLHASYGDFEDGYVDRNEILPKHFAKWVAFAKEHGLGLDFNPTFFSHPKANDGTLSSSDENIREFWIEHGIRCVRIAEYFANELGTPCTLNIWIPDGAKDIPADRTSPRLRLKDSLDKIIGIDYDKSKVLIAVESKVFGIGYESYTVGSHEFYMNYANKNNLLCLLDSGHFHPTEVVSDKISSMLIFADKLALHVTRPVRWDSDHVVLYDDEIREIAKEIIRNGVEKVIIGLDFFDASINRVAAWVVGMRNMQKALLNALLLPNEHFKNLQNNRELTTLMIESEELKLYPVGDVWNYFLQQCEVVSGNDIVIEIKKYEETVLTKRG